MAAKLGYYVLPIAVEWISPGPQMHDGDVWSNNMSLEELGSLIKAHDYLYIIHTDKVFRDKYSSLFDDVSVLDEGGLYRIRFDDEAINLVSASN